MFLSGAGRFVRSHQVNRASIIVVPCAGNPPITIATIRQIDSRVDSFLLANNFQIQLRYAVAILDADVAGNERAKIFHFANVPLESLVIPKISFGRSGRVAVRHRAEGKENDPAGKERHNQRQHRQDANDNQNDLFCGHRLMKIRVSKIVEERRIEQQAVDSIQHTAMPRQNVSSVFCSRTAFQSAFG